MLIYWKWRNITEISPEAIQKEQEQVKMVQKEKSGSNSICIYFKIFSLGWLNISLLRIQIKFSIFLSSKDPNNNANQAQVSVTKLCGKKEETK